MNMMPSVRVLRLFLGVSLFGMRAWPSPLNLNFDEDAPLAVTDSASAHLPAAYAGFDDEELLHVEADGGLHADEGATGNQRSHVLQQVSKGQKKKSQHLSQLPTSKG